MTDDLVTQALAELGDVVHCRCDAAFKDRGLHDPLCQCDSADALKVVTARIEADAATIARLTEESAERKDILENYRWAAREALDAAKEILAAKKAAEAQVAALVDVLERSADYIEKGMRDRSGPILRQARAAIAAAKEGK